MRLLVIEDDLLLQQSLKSALEGVGYSVDIAGDGEEGLFQAVEYDYDVAVIDVGLPKLDGISLIRAIRAKGIKYPVLILTARDHWQNKVEGLDAGADDYLTKPFEPGELIARLNALIRRSAGQASPEICNGALTINTASLSVKVNDKKITLSSSEYRLLEYLMLNKGQVKSKSALTEHIYDQDFDLDSNVIEVFIRRLRKKLDPEAQYNFIETHRGAGYLLRDLEC